MTSCATGNTAKSSTAFIRAKRLADGLNYNLRGQMWRAARDYLEEGGCSIARDPEFKSQVSSSALQLP